MTGFRIGSAFGIGLYVHWSFALLLGWVGWRAHGEDGTPAAIFMLLLVCAVFVCVILHELGHSLAARKCGVPTHSITLYPIGGVARLAWMPRNPRHELGIAIAGPAVNVGIAALLVPALFLTGLPGLTGEEDLSYDLPTFVIALIFYNVVMIVFNLIPAFPMDGGRVLRALIAWKGNYRVATEIAARLGQLFCLLFIAAGLGLIDGLDFSPTLLLIGGFIFFAAESERRQARRVLTPPPPPPPAYRPPPGDTPAVPPGAWSLPDLKRRSEEPEV